MKKCIAVLLFGLCVLLPKVPLAQDLDELKTIMKEHDSPKKLDQLLVWTRDNEPTGRVGRLVSQYYFSAVFSVYKSDQKKEILDHLHAFVDTAPTAAKADANHEAAKALMSRHLFPQDAVGFAQTALKASEDRMQKDRELELATLKKNEDAVHGAFLSTLGQTKVAAGDKQGGFTDLSNAFALIPTDDDTAVALARLYLGNDKQDDALNTLMPDIHSLTAGKEVTDLYVSVYAKIHNVSPSAANAELDSIFTKDEAALIKVTPFTDPLPAHPQIPLVEFFGSTSCGPCRAADIAVDAIPERYSRSQVIVIVYHQNIPDPDPLTSQETSDRGDFYSVEGTPTVIVNGEEVSDTGSPEPGNWSSVFQKLEKAIDQKLKNRTAAEIHLTASVGDSKVSGQVVLNGLSQIPGDLHLQILLVESPVRYAGENGMRFQPMVVRDMNAKSEGIRYDGSETQTLPFAFDLTGRNASLKAYLAKVENDQDGPFHFDNSVLPIDTHNLYIVAFVQNMKTKEIIQASITPLAPSATAKTAVPQ